VIKIGTKRLRKNISLNTYYIVAAFKSETVADNPLNAELNPICRLLALLGAHHILHVSRKRLNVILAVILKQTCQPYFVIEIRHCIRFEC